MRESGGKEHDGVNHGVDHEYVSRDNLVNKRKD